MIQAPSMASGKQPEPLGCSDGSGDTVPASLAGQHLSDEEPEKHEVRRPAA